MYIYMYVVIQYINIYIYKQVSDLIVLDPDTKMNDNEY